MAMPEKYHGRVPPYGAPQRRGRETGASVRTHGPRSQRRRGNCLYHERGVNAVIYASKYLHDIRDGRIDEETTANWTVFRAGSMEDREQVVTNVVCDHAEICGEARSRNKEKLDAYVSYVKEHFRIALED